MPPDSRKPTSLRGYKLLIGWHICFAQRAKYFAWSTVCFAQRAKYFARCARMDDLIESAYGTARIHPELTFVDAAEM